MKSNVIATFVVGGICAAVAFSVPLAAQQKNVRYNADLSGSRNCPTLKGASIRIDVKDDAVKGTWWGPNTARTNFEGKLKGADFLIIQEGNRGSQIKITGTVETDVIKLKLEFSTCTSNSVLKKA